MIDISNKEKTERMAKAMALVQVNDEIIAKIKNNHIPKGNVLENARIAGILAAKNTSSIIPLCHNIEIEYVGIDFKFTQEGIIIESSVKSTSKTGVEMEALVACTIAALTIYDMCKMFTKSIEIKDILLIEKRGGKQFIQKMDKPITKCKI